MKRNSNQRHGKGKVSRSQNCELAVFEQLETRELLSVTPAVTSFTLVNADTNQDIAVVQNGATLNLAALGTTDLNIRANVDGSVQCVKFMLDASKVRTESSAPYALAGDNNGDYKAWTPDLGQHSLTATAYVDKTAGTALTIQFTVVNQQVPPPTTTMAVTTLTLVNTDTSQDIGILQDGATLDLATLPTRNLSVRADVLGSTQSVVFALDGSIVRVENAAPYALMGDSGGQYYSWTPALGQHSLAATPYSADDATGTQGTALAIGFTVTDSSTTTQPPDTGTTDPTPTPTPTVPAAPSGLSVAAVSTSQLKLTWADNSDNETGFQIQRSTDGTNFTTVASVGANTTSYTDGQLSAATTYTYRLCATGDAGNSGYTAQVSATTQSVVTPSPGGYPDATTTGPSNPSLLHSVGEMTITTNGAVIENVDVQGMIYVAANNVTIRNFRADGVKIYKGWTGTLIEDGEVGPTTAGIAINGAYYTARRLNIHDIPGDAFRVGQDTTIEGCYVHNMTPAPLAHADAVQCIDTTARNITITGNYFDVRGANSAIFGTYMGWLIQGNYMNGGNYTIQTNGDASVQFIGNTFGRDAQYGIVRVGSGDRAALTWINNTYLDDGSLILL